MAAAVHVGLADDRVGVGDGLLHAAGAPAGGIARPLTILARFAGGGGGTYSAPPLASAPAVPAEAQQASDDAEDRSRTEGSDVAGRPQLFRTPTGLADGLALKELARLLERRFAPVANATLVPPFHAQAWIRRGGKLADVDDGILLLPVNPPLRGKAHKCGQPRALAWARMPPVNFTRDVVDAADRRGSRWWRSTPTGAATSMTFGDVADGAAAWRARSGRRGRPGDVVMTVIGNRPEWVLALVACFRIGAVALPCTEQLRRATCGRGWTRPSRGWCCATAQRGHRARRRLRRARC